MPEFEFGAVLKAKIVEIRERGVLVELHQNMDPVMLHISQLSASKVRTTYLPTYRTEVKAGEKTKKIRSDTKLCNVFRIYST